MSGDQVNDVVCSNCKDNNKCVATQSLVTKKVKSFPRVICPQQPNILRPDPFMDEPGEPRMVGTLDSIEE